MKSFNLDGALKRLNSMMHERFGVDVHYIPISERSPEAASMIETVRRNSGAPLIIAEGNMLIPVRVDGSLVGTTLVHGITRLGAREIGQIKDSIDLVLTGGLHLQSELDKQEIEMNQLEMAADPNNVINLGQFITRNKRMKSLFASAKEVAETGLPITLEAEDGTPTDEVAKDLGDDDSPFLTSDDHREALKSLDALQKLGPVTYFIPRLKNLANLEQETLNSYFDLLLAMPTLQGPQIIIATSEHPLKLAADGVISQRLAFHLSRHVLRLLPLRERSEDILPMIQNILLAADYGKTLQHFTIDVLLKLLDYSWPGNEGELRSEIIRLCSSRERGLIKLEALSAKIIGSGAKLLFRLIKEAPDLTSAIEALEKKMIAESLRRFGGNKSRVSRELGISRSGLIQKLDQYGISEA